MGLFSIQMVGTGATITQLYGQPNLDSTFTLTGGSLPFQGGVTYTGTHIGVNNNIDEYFGLNQGSIFMFLLDGYASISYSINGSEISNLNYSSGVVELKGPIVQSSDDITIVVTSLEPAPPTPPVTYFSFVVTSGATSGDSCSEVTTFTIYTDPYDDSACSGDLNAWACMPILTQGAFLDSGLTQEIPNGFYTSEYQTGVFGTYEYNGAFDNWSIC